MESRSALNLVIRMSRLAGVAPITNTPSGLRVSRPLMFYSYLLVTAINCIVLSGFALDLLTEPARSLRVRTPTSRVIWVGNLSIIILIASVAVYTSTTRMTSLIYCLKEIEKIKAFIGAKYKSDAGEKYKFLAVITTCVGLWTLIFFDLCGYALEALHRGTEVRTLLMYSFLFYEYFLVLLAQLQFALIVYHLQFTFRLVNNELQNLSLTEDKDIPFYPYSTLQRPCKKHSLSKVGPTIKISPKAFSFVTDSLPRRSAIFDNLKQPRLNAKRTVHDFAFLYSWICDIFRHIDNDHGLLLFLNVASFFLQLVITPYYLITELYATTGYISNVLLQIGWGLYHIMCMVLVVEPCYQIQNEMDKTKLLVCSMMHHATTIDLMTVELDLFTKQLILNRPTCSPLGLCTLSRPLTVTIIGAVTTYLVIIFQFRSNESGYNNY